MTAPLFRVLTKAELAKLSAVERAEYTARFIEHVMGQIEDNKQSIAAREKWLKLKADKPE